METYKIRKVVVSFIITFLSSFLSFLGSLLLTLPVEVLINPDAWKSGAVLGLLISVLRTALSETYKKKVPLTLGGEKKA